MFEITGVYDNKFITGGQVVRNKSAFKQHLNTEEGVMRFLEEMKPFVSVAVKDLEANKDATEYFLGAKADK